VIGPGVVVAAGAVVERSVLQAGARVEAGARVADSVLGLGAVLEEGASAVDLTIVGHGVEVAANTRVVAGRLAPAGFEEPTGFGE
jgi:mannose-1-phosphate guanylyltransferase